jgi:hypothetical protein
LKDEPVDEKKLAQEKELDNLVEKFEELAREAVVQLEKEVADIKDDAFNLPTNEELARALAQQQLDAREVSTDQETFE